VVYNEQHFFRTLSNNKYAASSKYHERYFAKVRFGTIGFVVVWLLSILNRIAVHIIKLGLNARVRAGIVVAVDSVLVFKKLVQLVSVNVETAVEV
jgi:hypothetical protein